MKIVVSYDEATELVILKQNSSQGNIHNFQENFQIYKALSFYEKKTSRFINNYKTCENWT